MSAYAMFSNTPLPVGKSSCQKPSFSLSSNVGPLATAVVSLPDTKSSDWRCDSKSYHKKDVEEIPSRSKTSSIASLFESDNKREPSNDLGIAVMSANVDLKRYIAATSRARRNIPTTKDTRNKVETASTNDSSSWEEAVEFEISITLNGRTYTRRRSFPRIVRLRNELVKEVRNRRRNHPGRFGVLRSLVFDAPSSSSSSNERKEKQKLEQEVVFGDNDDCVTTNLCDVRGLSLSMMQSKLNGSYCPAIETWLQSVSSEVVDPQMSPSLADFLKEDSVATAASASMISKRHVKKRYQHSNQLWSISEDQPCIEKDDLSCKKREEHDTVCSNDLPPSSADFDEDNECDAYFNAI